LNVPVACSLSLCAIWIVASMRITTVGPRSTSATCEAGMPPCRASISAHTWRRIFARAVAIHARWSAPISSNARHSVGSEATGPYNSP
jgi:hypothetical protein